MRIALCRLRLAISAVVALLAMCVCAGVDSATPKHVLIIHSFGRDFEPYATIASVFRANLAQSSSDTILFYEATFDAGRKASTQEEQTFVDYLSARFAGNTPDLVVTLGPPAARFYLGHRDQLFPETALLMTGLEERLARGAPLRPRDAAVLGKLDLPPLVENILRVLPETRTIAVVVGASELERYWLAELQTAFAPLRGRVQFLWLNDLSLEQMKERVATLPPQSAVLLAILIVDAAGVPHDLQDALTSLHAVAKAPMFGFYETELGRGIVGGPYAALRRNGERAAAAALRIMNDAAPTPPQVEAIAYEPPVYDWRELERWNIDPARLPPGSEIRFKPPSVWEEHRIAIIAVVTAFVLQAALIAALLLQRILRRRAEREAQSLGGRLITAYEDERRRLARDLHDDVTQRLAGLAIEAAKIDGANGAASRQAAHEIRDGLVELSEDVHALSYQLHPSIIEDLGLVEALRAECDRVARQETIRVDLDSSAVPAKLPSDTAICLFRVAQEALRNVVRHARASKVEIALLGKDGGISLDVRDNGAGFDDSRKRDRASLGLASMRERVRLQGGRIDIESGQGRGTVVVAWIPLQGGA